MCSATAVEGLLSSRFEGSAAAGLKVRIKLGAGVGNQSFGAPAFRAVLGIEIFGQRP